MQGGVTATELRAIGSADVAFNCFGHEAKKAVLVECTVAVIALSPSHSSP
jgi:hypothetical protein